MAFIIYPHSTLKLCSTRVISVADTANVDPNIAFKHILTNNLKLIILLIIGGFLFGIPTIVNLFVNGLNFALLMKIAFSCGISVEQFILLTLPHGVFEIAAVIFGGAAGFKIPFEVVRYLLGRKNKVLTKEDLREFLTLSLIAIVLIIVAAWIEAYVTSDLAKSIIEKSQLG